MISLLSSVPEFEVVDEARTGEEAVMRAAQLQPDVVLMGLQMPEVNGIEATRRILQESPSIRVLVVTIFEDDDSVFMALRAGGRVRFQGRRREGDGARDPLIRRWCAQDASEEFDQVLTLQEEVDRLRTLVQEIARWLNHNGHPMKAGLLRKELGKVRD